MTVTRMESEMTYSEFINWLRFFKQEKDTQDKPAETEWTRDTALEVFNLG